MGSASDFLIARLQIAFDHNTFYETFDILVASSCVQNVFDDTDLLLVFLSGVGMVGIDDGSRVYEMCFVVFLQQKLNVLVVIVRHELPCLLVAPRRMVCASGFPLVFTSQVR